ncbi:MAG: aminodeoxychorismate/anthranilate synthase component II [Actinobacteria bacterium]|nr:aminodeoxychorismate/anthranilate synthase component II [Actinomycetota bacterium]NBP17940.1 aminodeoxychorismate/anthranilate synthase component II [Actinomycetota bacterium]NBY57770.1 aminodeoxychorismate/anthranilate synthase component II [Actinomycetota bacterium]NCY08935.1 aminodeoxychorismate/anthranilate synthase component II [Actinomycetota bacterium]NDC46809.1 aminodeoxychorismate/anthranilate synthase component II [Actinomycetota bacterium]
MSAPRVLVVDNYDSFVYNLVQYLGELGADVEVVRNDEASVDALLATAPDAIVISPGPGRPEDAGVSCELIRRAVGRTPLLGVCLGHQAIGHVFGAAIVRAPELRHGKTSTITHNESGIFAGLPSPLDVTRYHSLVIEPHSLPDTLVATATTSDGTVMAVRHRDHPIEGVQFHPESILTAHGHALLRNFLSLVR